MHKIERVWVDIETTGLEVENDPILEIGIALTDRWGNMIDSEAWYVGDEYAAAAIKGRGMKNPFVNEMHTKSGLWGDWGKAYSSLGDEMAYDVVDEEIIAWLDDSMVQHGKFPMCGSSVRFDRQRIEFWLPKTAEHFHYRIIDNSSTKEMCKDLNAEVYAKLDTAVPKREMHRPLHDLVDTINEYKFYVDNFLFVTDGDN